MTLITFATRSSFQRMARTPHLSAQLMMVKKRSDVRKVITSGSDKEKMLGGSRTRYNDRGGKWDQVIVSKARTANPAPFA